jgi:hypothetical protein
MFLDVPEVTMRLGSESKRFRIIPEVMGSPMPAQQLPGTLSQFASVLDATSAYTPRLSTIDFGGPGLASYGPDCQVDFLAP